MEIAFFFGGMTRTASDQCQSSLQSGSLRIDALISASVSLRSLSKSVLPFRRGASRETIVIFLSFIAPRTPRRYDPTHVTSKRTNDDDFYVVEKAEYHVAHFAFSIRAPNERRTIEDYMYVIKV